MTVPIAYTNTKTSLLVNSLSRYINSKVIRWGSPSRLTFTTYVKKAVKPSTTDSFAVIPGGSEYRPDKVSQEVYGTPDLWWKILEANGIMDIFEFKAGLTIRLPGNIF